MRIGALGNSVHREGWNGTSARQREAEERKLRSRMNRTRKRARNRARRKAARLTPEQVAFLSTEPDPGRAGAIMVGEDHSDPGLVAPAERKIIVP